MKPNPQLNQIVKTTIQRLGIHGEGIGYWHGYTVFIEGALPGEEVQARLVERKRKYGRETHHDRKLFPFPCKSTLSIIWEMRGMSVDAF